MAQGTSTETIAPLQPATAATNKPTLVGGELLGRQRNDGGYFEPLVTEAVEGQRFVLLPHKQYIAVLSYVTGQRLGILVLDETNIDEEEHEEDDDELQGNKPVFVECAALAWTPKNQEQSLSRAMMTQNKQAPQPETISSQSLFVGCSNGCLLEFWIADLLLLRPSASHSYDMGDYCLPGPVYYPRRRIRLAAHDSQPIQFLSFPKRNNHLQDAGDKDILCYALVQTATDQDNKGDITWSNLSLLRVKIPPYTPTTSYSENPSIQEINLTCSGEEEEKTPSSTTCLAILECDVGSNKSNLTPQFSQPVRLISCPCGAKDNGGIMIIVARRGEVKMFYDDLRKEKAFANWLVVSPNDPMTTMALSPNQSSMACGHESGKIYILNDFVRLYHDYMTRMERFVTLQGGKSDDLAVVTNKPKEPTILRRKLHWHAHSVATLSYESNSVAEEPFLYSGGVESVLCGWQLARGEDKPAVLLPRIALGAIAHISHVDASSSSNNHAGLLVYCMDGTLQVFNVNNLKVKWKASSIPAPESNKDGQRPSIQMRVVGSPMKSESRSVAFFGSPEVAGFIHWQDPESQALKRSLDVAPFNRVSRTEASDEELPPPMVIHAAWSDTGRTIMTVDVVSTEIPSYGAHQTHPDGTPFGSLTSLKFWAATSSGVAKESEAYRVVAELQSPHGKTNTIGAAALSRTGDLACTLSPEEKSFRVWEKRKNVSFVDAEHDETASWFCRYRITFPSGFSNHATMARAVSFSADDSTLAIGFGNFVTLWDVDEQVLLAALPHANDDMEAVVDRISFLPSGSLLCDMMLTCSQRHIAVQSPFGHCGARNLGWCWSLPEQKGVFIRDIAISCAEYIEANDCIAVALYNALERKSTVLLLDVETGKDISKNNQLKFPGKITDIASLQTPATPSSGWEGLNRTTAESSLDLVVVLEGGRSFRWSKGGREVVRQTKRQDTQVSVPVTPSIPSLSDHMFNSRKRAAEALSSMDLELVSRKKLSVERFGQLDGEPLGDEQLPLLSGAFAKAFLARHLYKKE